MHSASLRNQLTDVENLPKICRGPLKISRQSTLKNLTITLFLVESVWRGHLHARKDNQASGTHQARRVPVPQ